MFGRFSAHLLAGFFCLIFVVFLAMRFGNWKGTRQEAHTGRPGRMEKEKARDGLFASESAALPRARAHAFMTLTTRCIYKYSLPFSHICS